MNVKNYLLTYIQLLKEKKSVSILSMGAGSTFILKIIGAALGFISQVVLARILGVNEYGIFIYVFTCAQILALTSNLGFLESLVRFIPEYMARKEWNLYKGIFRQSFLFVFITSFLIALSGVILAILFPELIGEDRVRTFCIAMFSLPFLSLMGTEQATLRGLKKVVLANLPEFIIRPAFLLSAILIVHFFFVQIKLTSFSATAIHAAVLSITFSIGLIFIWKTIPENVKLIQADYLTKKWFSVSLPFLIIALLFTLTKHLNLLMIGAYMDNTSAGIFGALIRITVLVNFGLNSVNMIAAPLISELFHKNKKDELNQLLRISAWGIIIATLLACGFFAGIGKWLLSFWGPTFNMGYYPLLVLLLGEILTGLSGVSGFLMLMTGHHNSVVLISFIALTVNLILCLILIPLYGIMGATIASVCSVITCNLGMLIYVHKKMGLNPTIFSY